MNGTSQHENTESPPKDADKDASFTPLILSENGRNTHFSRNDDQPQHYDKLSATSPLTDIERSSGTVYGVQKEPIPEENGIKVYKRRWIVLGIFFLYTIVGSYQWSMYTIIANVISKYYRVSYRSVDFTGLSFLIGYLITFLPASWILNNWGTRSAMIISCVLHIVGCVMRLFSVPADRFWLTMIGQCIVAVSQVFIPMLPARLAAVWFPAHQVSFACAAGINGMIVGSSIGFLFPPLLVRNSDNFEDIARDLNRVYIGLAVLSLFSLLLTVAFFKEKPPLPPSKAQKLLRARKTGEESSESPKEFLESMKRLCNQRDFLILVLTSSLITTTPIVISTMLNQILISHFPGSEKEVGIAGVLLCVPGIASSAICGYILDRTHAFKKTLLYMYIWSTIGWIAFAALLKFGDIIWMYIASTIIGISTGGMWVVGLELVIEVTYPEPEGTSGGIMSGVVQLGGVLATLAYGYMFEYWSEDVTNAIATVPLGAACVILFFLKPTLKRQAAQRTKDVELEDLNRLS